MDKGETYQALSKIDTLLEEAVDGMKTTMPGSLALEIRRIEEVRQLLVYVRDLTTHKPSEFVVPLASLAQKPHSGTVCKNAILEAKQAMLDLSMREENVEHILFAILARGILIHFPVTPE